MRVSSMPMICSHARHDSEVVDLRLSVGRYADQPPVALVVNHSDAEQLGPVDHPVEQHAFSIEVARLALDDPVLFDVGSRRHGHDGLTHQRSPSP